jgi:hypothetical protein
VCNAVNSKNGEGAVEVRMKLRYLLLALLAFVILAGSAYAAYPSLASGYAVESNYHGVNVPPGADVIVTAYTTDASVYQVNFLWKYPNGTVAFGPEVDNTKTTEAQQYNGKTVYTFSSEHTPNEIGDWGVQALFQSPNGRTKQDIDYVVAIRATSFNVAPEVPIIGTIGASAMMLLGLGFYMKKRRVF